MFFGLELPDFGIAECSVRGVGIAFTEHTDLARSKRTVAGSVKVLRIDEEIDVAVPRDDCNGIGLILAGFDDRRRVAEQVFGVSPLVVQVDKEVVGTTLADAEEVEL